MGHDILLTGLPRAGTTLAAALLDGLPDAVCLNEPAWQAPDRPAAAYAQALAADFIRLRRCFLRGEPVPDRRGPGGAALTNYFSDGKILFHATGLTRAGLTETFTLAVKHNAPYLSALPELIALRHFRIIAVIRHPLPVIASWRRLDLPVSRGEMPGAVRLWPEMRELVMSRMPLLEKQVRMADLMYRRIDECREHIAVVRYETLVKEPRRLAESAGIQALPDASLIHAPPEVPQDGDIAAALTAHGRWWRHFYA